MRTYIYTYMHAYIHTYIYIYVHMQMYVCMYAETAHDCVFGVRMFFPSLRPLVYDFDLMMEKRRAQQRRSRKRKRDINDLTVDDDIVEDLIGKMRHAAEGDRKLNLAQRAATKKLALLPVLVESLKKYVIKREERREIGDTVRKLGTWQFCHILLQ